MAKRKITYGARHSNTGIEPHNKMENKYFEDLRSAFKSFLIDFRDTAIEKS